MVQNGWGWPWMKEEAGLWSLPGKATLTAGGRGECQALWSVPPLWAGNMESV